MDRIPRRHRAAEVKGKEIRALPPYEPPKPSGPIESNPIGFIKFDRVVSSPKWHSGINNPSVLGTILIFSMKTKERKHTTKIEYVVNLVITLTKCWIVEAAEISGEWGQEGLNFNREGCILHTNVLQ